jgi:hypothetical protein
MKASLEHSQLEVLLLQAFWQYYCMCSAQVSVACLAAAAAAVDCSACVHVARWLAV